MRASEVFWSLVGDLVEREDATAPVDDDSDDEFGDVGAGAGDQSAAFVNSELATFEERLRRHVEKNRGRRTHFRPIRKPMARDGLGWSPEAAAFSQLVKADVGRNRRPELRTREYQASFFANVVLDERKIGNLDDAFVDISGIRTLSLNRNRIRRLGNLPHAVEQLDCYDNSISEVEARYRLKGLVHAGLGYNRLTSAASLSRVFPNLLSLDLSGNDLCSLPALCAHLATLSQLQQLWVLRNPLALNAQFGDRLTAACPRLLFLDGAPVRDEEDVEGEPAGPAQARRPDLEPAPEDVLITIALHGLENMPPPAVADARSAEAAPPEGATAAAGKGKGKAGGKGKGGKPDPDAEAAALEEQQRREAEPVDEEHEVHFVATIDFALDSDQVSRSSAECARWRKSTANVAASATWQFAGPPTPRLRDALLLEAATVTIRQITPVPVLAILRAHALEERAAYDALAAEERAERVAPQVPEEATAPLTAVVASFKVPMDALLGPEAGGNYEATEKIALELKGPAAVAQRAISEGASQAPAPATASVDVALNRQLGSASDSATAAQDQ